MSPSHPKFYAAVTSFSLGLCATALTAAIGFLWNMNSTMATVALTQQYHAEYLGALNNRVEELRQSSIRVQLEVSRVESQCLMMVESVRKRN